MAICTFTFAPARAVLYANDARFPDREPFLPLARRRWRNSRPTFFPLRANVMAPPHSPARHHARYRLALGCSRSPNGARMREVYTLRGIGCSLATCGALAFSELGDGHFVNRSPDTAADECLAGKRS